MSDFSVIAECIRWCMCNQVNLIRSKFIVWSSYISKLLTSQFVWSFLFALYNIVLLSKKNNNVKDIWSDLPVSLVISDSDHYRSVLGQIFITPPSAFLSRECIICIQTMAKSFEIFQYSVTKPNHNKCHLCWNQCFISVLSVCEYWEDSP